MFSFNLPRGAVVTATTPDGVTLSMLHAGDGRFLTNVPPTVMAGMALVGETAPTGNVPVTWDGATFPGDADVEHCAFGFDVHAARDALFSASDAGDNFARLTMQRMAAAAALLDAPADPSAAGGDSEGGAPD